MPSHRVTLLPSRHQFNASSKQSLLKAGLESGLNLRYGCEGGSCGDCLARLVEGDIEATCHSDFVLSPQQKANQYFLSCCHAAVSDCYIEATEIGSVNEIAQQQIEARVYRLQKLSDNVMSIFLKTPRTQPLRFLAGQYVNIQLNDQLQRNKSIASCPCDGLKPEIHVRLRSDDEFSEHVFARLKKNDQISIQGPLGEFVLDDDSSRPLLFIAYDTGFAGIKSLLEHAIALEKEQPVQLYWIVTPHGTPYQENYCRAIEDALDNFSYFPLSIKEDSEKCIKAVLAKIIKQEAAIKYSDVFMILPDAFRAMAESQFIEAGIDSRHWNIDSFQKL